MKRLGILIVLAIACIEPYTINAQSAVNALAKSYSISIDNKSFVLIVGRTNVNTFECSYNSELSYKSITIGINKDPQGKVCFDDAVIQLSTNSFDCGIREMTKDFKSLLQGEKHPYITMDVECMASDLLASSVDQLLKIKITIAGIANYYYIPVQIKKQGKQLHCIGKKDIDIQDFNIEPPVKFMGLIKVHNIITVEFNLILTISKSPSSNNITRNNKEGKVAPR